MERPLGLALIVFQVDAPAACPAPLLDQACGEDPRQVLDLYVPAARSPLEADDVGAFLRASGGRPDRGREERLILYRLKTSVLEDALIEFAERLGIGAAGKARRPKRKRVALWRGEA